MIERPTPTEKIEQGETVRFVWHDWNDNEPVKQVMEETQAVGQLDLPLFAGLQTIWVFKPKKE